MIITWLGHACFKIESSGFSIIIDPYQDNYVPGYAPIREKANLVLCSHQHNDHNGVETVKLETASYNPMQITVIDTYHDDKQGSLRGENKIHIIDDGTVRIAHFGDIGCELTKDQIEMLKNLDAAMIPVGGTYTIDSMQANELIKQIQPGIIIPMHYRGNGFGFDVLEMVEVFTQQQHNVRVLQESYIEILPTHSDEIVVLYPELVL
jgi:L-ascorbate metabolism protein UlaG (beta-lactamase superfamily)